MPSTQYIGVDFGSLGCRFAHFQNGQVVAPARGDSDRWLRCEPSTATGFGLSFPSVKSLLGTTARVPTGTGSLAADEAVTGEFRILREQFESQSGSPAGQVVIAVPASYSSFRRAALRDAVQHAGFRDVHLLNDSMAAVMSYAAESSQSANVLVVSAGYAGFELGLVRSARGRFRSLGYEAAETPSGAGFEEMLIRTWLAAVSDALSRANLVFTPHPREWAPAFWLQVRAAAQQVKENPRGVETVAFGVPIVLPENKQAFVPFGYSRIEEAIAPALAAMADLAVKLIEGADLSLKDVDAILLVGGTTRMRLVSSLLEQRLGKKPVALEPEALAKGAALYHRSLEGRPLPGPSLGEAVEASPAQKQFAAAESALGSVVLSAGSALQAPAGSPVLSLTLEARPAGSGPQALAADPKQHFLEEIRRLVAEGRKAEAAATLNEVTRLARKVLGDAPPVQSAPPANPTALRVIQQALNLLLEGKQIEEAVKQSHLAWQLDPDNPDVFDQMIEIHCQAAMAHTSIEGFQTAKQWLECAHSHDQSNPKVRELLADRLYTHAKQLADSGRRREALAALEQSLSWSPEHEKGNALQRVLSRRV